MKRRGRRLLVDLVRQRIERIYLLAVEAAKRGEWDYSSRLGSYIKELSRATRVRMDRRIKRGLCKKCSIPLIPGVTATVRTRSQGCFAYIVIRCRTCGWIHRYPYRTRCT
ncbi:MAG: ribonuclease P Rpr2/Rpp21/SNM1 subunit [Desulfurococcales archaeon]|nr:ribonuclease P Rpr2/Rpp21/SNM1 subunit [Desulfurococcales archaeon]